MSEKTRRVVRTTLQVVVGVALAVPVIVQATGLTAEQVPWLATVVAVAAAFARVMQSPAVEGLLQRYAPWLAAAPAPRIVEGDAVVVDDHDAPPGA